MNPSRGYFTAILGVTAAILVLAGNGAVVLILTFFALVYYGLSYFH